MYVVRRDRPYFVSKQKTGDGPDVIAGQSRQQIFSFKIHIYLTNSMELFYLHSEDK